MAVASISPWPATLAGDITLSRSGLLIYDTNGATVARS